MAVVFVVVVSEPKRWIEYLASGMYYRAKSRWAQSESEVISSSYQKCSSRAKGSHCELRHTGLITREDQIDGRHMHSLDWAPLARFFSLLLTTFQNCSSPASEPITQLGSVQTSIRPDCSTGPSLLAQLGSITSQLQPALLLLGPFDCCAIATVGRVEFAQVSHVQVDVLFLIQATIKDSCLL